MKLNTHGELRLVPKIVEPVRQDHLLLEVRTHIELGRCDDRLWRDDLAEDAPFQANSRGASNTREITNSLGLLVVVILLFLTPEALR